MNRWDVLVMVGLLILAGGVALVYIPAGIIVLGAGVIALGIVGAVSDARAQAPEGKDES